MLEPSGDVVVLGCAPGVKPGVVSVLPGEVSVLPGVVNVLLGVLPGVVTFVDGVEVPVERPEGVDPDGVVTDVPYDGVTTPYDPDGDVTLPPDVPSVDVVPLGEVTVLLPAPLEELFDGVLDGVVDVVPDGVVGVTPVEGDVGDTPVEGDAGVALPV